MSFGPHFARGIAAQVSGVPMMVHPGHGSDVAASLRAMEGAAPTDQLAAFEAKKPDLAAAYGLPAAQPRKVFAYSNGVAVVPIHGLLLNRFHASWGFATGYNFIRSQVQAAASDPDVATIVLDVNSFGGMAAGCIETADIIYAARKAKPVVAVIDAYAFSAGYALASAATRVVITPTGGAGSIGTVVMHVSFEKAHSEAGLEVTFIHAGEKKVDGSPYKALSKSARADLQQHVDHAFRQFVGQVSRNRGLAPEVIRATQAGVFVARDALERGLVDVIAQPEAALSASHIMEEDEATMSGTKTMSQADVQARIDAEVAKRLAAERNRISAITKHEAAKGREALADHLARNTAMSVEDAVAILSVAAADAPALAGANAFKTAMDNGATPGVGADGGAGPDQGGDKVASTLSLFTSVIGFKAPPAAQGPVTPEEAMALRGPRGTDDER